MKQINYCVYREDDFHAAQRLNVDVSSFGATEAEAVSNLREAVELYLEGESDIVLPAIVDVKVGEELIHA